MSHIVGEQDIVVIGSQSILGSSTDRELPDPAIASIEADLAFFDDPDNTKSDEVDGAIGEDSQFHATFGYYGQGDDRRIARGVARPGGGFRERRYAAWPRPLDRPPRPGRELCPYSNATRGNIDVVLTVDGLSLEAARAA